MPPQYSFGVAWFLWTYRPEEHLNTGLFFALASFHSNQIGPASQSASVSFKTL